MDSDLFPLINTEELFQMEIQQTSSTEPPFDYSFAAAPNLVEKNGNDYVVGIGFNAGFFMLKPSVEIFDKLWNRALDPEQPWNFHKDMEQGLLNDFFASGGQVPLFPLHWSWNVKDMQDDMIPESKVVHARYLLLVFFVDQVVDE